MSSASALAQSAGRLNVGMPTATLAVPGAGSVAYQPPLSRLTVGVGGDVEPDPAAVLERLERHLDLDDGRLIVGADELAALHEDPRPGGLGPVDVDAPGSGQLDPQHHRLADRPAAPVAGRERIEVRRERHLGLLADLQRGAARRVRAPGVGGRLLQVKLAHVEGFTRTRQDDSGQQAHGSHPRAPSSSGDAVAQVRREDVVVHVQCAGNGHMHIQILVGAQPAAEQHLR